MKNCEKCNKKVKNGFKLCYSCNETRSETSEPETAKQVYVKESIPRTVKNCLWINYFGKDMRRNRNANPRVPQHVCSHRFSLPTKEEINMGNKP